MREGKKQQQDEQLLRKGIEKEENRGMQKLNQCHSVQWSWRTTARSECAGRTLEENKGRGR
jgi:hypothetical protein